MKRKRTLVISLIVFVLLLVFLNFATVYFFGLPLSPVAMTGKVVETGYVRLYIEGESKVITIYSPENTTYDNGTYTCVTGELPKCNNNRYFLDLNVSASFYLENNSDWRYWLYDSNHGVYVEENTQFDANASVSFVRWGNVLTVSVEEEDGDWVNESVVFTIDVPNSAPLIQNFTEKIFVCETQRINPLSSSNFNVYDIDEENFNTLDNYDIKEGGIFGIVSFLKDPLQPYINPLQIVSVYFGKAHLGDHVLDVTVYDSDRALDTKTTNVTVIEINNVPTIDNKLKAATVEVWINGSNSVFSYQVQVDDEEDGTSDDGNLTFNLTWTSDNRLDFDINASTGVMYYEPQEGDQGSENKQYPLTVCVSDNALSSVHENFSICSLQGYSNDSLSDCDSFFLVITNKNRAPNITAYSPATLSFSVPGTIDSSFSVTVSDDDMGEGYYPGIDWYLDDVLQANEGSENIATDDYSYTFGCGVSGIHNVIAVTSDGPLNDSVMWTINVTNVACPVAVVTGGSSGGGGGGGGTLGGVCNEQWACHGWGLCQNAERSFDAGALSPEDYSSTKDLCAQNSFDDRFCGFQITRCFDLAMCNNTEVRIPKPVESRVCYFTEDPNCIDGITNCHDGDCELLVDCGGPCDPCPTCSDGKRNQGENGVDCGGPCPFACEAESPFGAISFALVGLLLVLFLVLMYILYKVFKILRHRFFLKGKKRKKEDKR